MKVLIAEDDEDSRSLLCAILEGKGHLVMSAPDGQKALEIARKSAPDIIITDILMPKMDGYSLCREIKSDPKLAHIAVVFYTATYQKDVDEKLGLAIGASRYILKPQEPTVFIKILDDIIKEHQAKGLPVSKKSKEPSKSLTTWHEEVLINKLLSKVADLRDEKNALFLSEEKHRKLVESLNKDFIFFSYDAQEKLTYLSEVQNILGYSQEEFLTRHAKSLTRSFAKQQDAWLKQPHEYEKSNHFELEIEHKNGDIHYLEVKETPVFDSEGTLTAIDGVAQDVTRKRAQQKLLEEAKKQLATSEKLASIGQLSAGVSHEILNPLNILSLQTQILKRSNQDDPKTQDFCVKVENEVNRITKVTSALRTFSRKAEARKTKISFNEIIEGVTGLIDQSLDNISINTAYCEPPCEIFADKDQMRKVFINLFNNAKQAMPEGGVFSLTGKRKNTKKGTFAQITVSDTGEGIKNENLSKIFDPFFTTRPQGEGTGMGLAVTHGIIQEHNGTITVESNEGKGTTFTINLPIKEHPTV